MRNLLIAALVLVSCNAIAAGAYRWVDAQGQVHFSDQPPADLGSAERVNIKVSSDHPVAQPVSAKTATAKQEQPTIPSKPQTRSEKATQKAQDEQRAANCRTAKANLEAFNRNHSMRFTLPDGSVRPLTAEERAERVKRSEEAVKEYCK